jgi:hypothetical protein
MKIFMFSTVVQVEPVPLIKKISTWKLEERDKLPFGDGLDEVRLEALVDKLLIPLHLLVPKKFLHLLERKSQRGFQMANDFTEKEKIPKKMKYDAQNNTSVGEGAPGRGESARGGWIDGGGLGFWEVIYFGVGRRGENCSGDVN